MRTNVLNADQKKIRNEIKKINTRIQALADDYGMDSATYRKAVMRLQRDFGDFLHTTQKGTVAITQTKANIERTKGKKSIKDVLNVAKTDVKTKTQLLKPFQNEISERLMSDAPENYSEIIEDIMARISDMDTIHESFESVKEQYYELFSLKQRQTGLADMYASREFGTSSKEELARWTRKMKEKIHDLAKEQKRDKKEHKARKEQAKHLLGGNKKKR